MKKFSKAVAVALVLCACAFSVSCSYLADADIAVEDESELLDEFTYLSLDGQVIPENKYYAVTSASPEWKTFKASRQMEDACRIGDATIDEMSTEQLVEAVVTFPLLIDLYAYNDLDYALDRLAQKSDAYRELRQRDDAVECLTALYDNIVANSNRYNECSLTTLTLEILLSDSKLPLNSTPMSERVREMRYYM